LQGIISTKTELFIVTNMRASNPMNMMIFEVLPAVTLKINVFWAVITYSLADGCGHF
jgi:hypothetical protein